MIYSLRKQQGSEVYYLIRTKEYAVGRKNTDVIIEKDQSISRKHALIKIKDNFATITDCGSKYGTFINSAKLEANTEISLGDKDVIKFGIFESVYILEKVPIVTTCSGFNNDQRDELKNNLSTIGAVILPNWETECTHLTANEIILTIKVLHAIVDGKPIVTAQFWDKLISNVTEMKPPPDPSDFQPPLTEVLINQVNLNPNPQRNALFKDKTFVFTTEKVKKKMAELIQKTGGICTSWERRPLSLSEFTKTKNKYVFVYSENVDDIPETLKEFSKNLRKLGERLIPIQEIPMAIVYCSCEQDCNPKFNRLNKVFNMQPIDTQEVATSLVMETPSEADFLESVLPKREVVIPESLDAEFDFSKNAPQESAKYTNSVENQENDPPPKKRKVDVKPSTSHNATKNQSVQKPETPKTAPKPIKQEVASVTKKRKSNDALANSAKKPFVISVTKCKEVDEDNPFAAVRMKRELINDDEDNPFLQVIKTQNAESVEDDENLDMKRSESPILSSASTSYVPSDTCQIQWISTKEKKEQDENHDLDPETREFVDRFRNSIVVDVLPKTIFRAVIPKFNYYDSSSSCSGSTQNFKKFRKVLPLKPQTTILITSIYEEEPSLDALNVTLEDEDSQDVEVETRPQAAQVNASPQFDF